MTAIAWHARADLPLPRAGYAAGVINSRFVVAGGSFWSGNEKRRTAAVDIYNPAAGRWSPGPPLPAVLSDAVGVSAQHVVYVTGGLTDHGPNLDTLLLTGGTWTVIPGLRLPEAKIRASAVADGSRIYVIGGQRQFGNEEASDQVWMSDVANPSDGWTALPPYPPGPHVVSAAAVWNGAMYVFGGFRIRNGAGENDRGIWRFDLGRHTWIKVGELPEPRRAFGAGAGEREILLFGGYTDAFSPQVLAFDPRTEAVRAVGALPQAVADARFVRIRNHWYTAGGEVGIRIRGRHTWEGSET